jgi:hypothetical protein
MQQDGLIAGFTPADTYAELLTGIQNSGGRCIIGMTWWNSEFTVLPSGQNKITKSSGVAGGHELVAVGHDSINGRLWILNSWGYWGVCIASQVNAQTKTTGAGCGYAWIADADMTSLFASGNAEGDCPTLPTKLASNDNATRAVVSY